MPLDLAAVRFATMASGRESVTVTVLRHMAQGRIHSSRVGSVVVMAENRELLIVRRRLGSGRAFDQSVQAGSSARIRCSGCGRSFPYGRAKLIDMARVALKDGARVVCLRPGGVRNTRQSAGKKPPAMGLKEVVGTT